MIRKSAYTWALLALSLLNGFAAQENPTVEARRLAQEATQAQKQGDLVSYLEKSQRAVALRPDYPRLLIMLAEAQLLNSQPKNATVTLGTLADLGLTFPFEQMPEFAAWRTRSDARAIVDRLVQNRTPVGLGKEAIILPLRTGLIEGIAWRQKTGDLFFSDVHERCVWLRKSDGTVTRFSREDERVLGVFGLKIDESHGLLWAATSAVPMMRGFSPSQKGAAGLIAFDLKSGELLRSIRIPMDEREHVVGDLALAPDGSIFATDSFSPVLWRLAPGAQEIEAYLTSDDFISLQGLAFSPEGRLLYLTDYLSGLLVLDLSNKAVSRVTLPPRSTLVGSDGLICTAQGDLIVIQNGVQPSRILRLTLGTEGRSVTQAKVLEAAHAAMADVTLGCIAADDLVFIANGGWELFGESNKAPTARDIPILRTHVTSMPK